MRREKQAQVYKKKKIIEILKEKVNKCAIKNRYKLLEALKHNIIINKRK